jgi:hypothetical protein
MRLGAMLSAGVLASGCMLTLTTDNSQGEGQTQSSEASCTNPPPPPQFANALCLCEDLAAVGSGLTTAPMKGTAANVGVNGITNVVGQDHIDGSLVAYGGLSGVGDLAVRDDALTTKDVQGVGTIDVGGDLSVGGNLSGVGQLTVGGTLRVAGSTMLVGQSVVATGPYSPPSGPPCGCDPSSLIDVPAIVAAAANGQATHLTNVGQQALTLQSGSYYWTGADSVGTLQITIAGAVKIYVQGDLNSVGSESFTLSQGATLDLYVSGNVSTVGEIAAGNASDFRLYVGGTGSMVMSVGSAQVQGDIYAPTAEVDLVGDTRLDGSLFAKRLSGVGSLDIRYSAPAGQPPPSCDGGTGGGADAGSSSSADAGGAIGSGGNQ